MQPDARTSGWLAVDGPLFLALTWIALAAPVAMVLFQSSEPGAGSIALAAILIAALIGSISATRRAVRNARVWDNASMTRAAGLAVLSALIAFLYLYNIGENPLGMFCDEAQIGFQAYRFWSGEAEIQPIPLFMRNFNYVHVGSPPFIAAVPFVAVFEMDAFAIRLTSAVLMLASMVAVYCTLRRMRIDHAATAVAVFALTPIVIHLGRVNVGHTISMFLLALGFYLFVRARQQGRWVLAAWSGVCFGISAYSNGPYYVFTPMLLGIVGVSELCFNRSRAEWKSYLVMAGAAALWLFPFVYSVLTNPEFMSRVTSKQMHGAGLFSLERLQSIASSYPRYFGFEFLFEHGPGDYVLRHAVDGVGVLSWLMLPITAVALYGVVRCWRHPAMRFLLPWAILVPVYPLPDLISNTPGQAPYTFALFGAVLAIPYICALALLAIRSHADMASAAKTADGSRQSAFAATAVTALAVYAGVSFYVGPYARYPAVSSGYWGWQYGPREMIRYYQAHWRDYDDFLMDGNYNEAWIFLDFYIRDYDERQKASISDISRFDPSRRQLFGVRAEEWAEKPQKSYPSRGNLRIRHVFRYPSGEPAALMVELNPAARILRGQSNGTGSWTY